MRTGGGMIAFEVKGGYEAAMKLMDYFAKTHPQRDSSGNLNEAPVHLCVSLGALTTYIQHPASMTHACVPREQRLEQGITDALVCANLLSISIMTGSSVMVSVPSYLIMLILCFPVVFNSQVRVSVGVDDVQTLTNAFDRGFADLAAN